VKGSCSSTHTELYTVQ